MATDIEDFAEVIAQAIETATAPLLARIAVLEKRQLTHGRDGRDGKDAQVDLDALAMKAAALVPRPRDGVDGAQGPQGPKGDTGVATVMAGPPGNDGKDAPAVDLDALAVKAAALVPRARDGHDGKDADLTVITELKAEIAMLRSELHTKSLGMRDGRDGQDGVGLSDAFIDRDGALVFTFSNGQTKSVGRVVGADGRPGADGQNGTNGADGRPGADGLGFDDLDATMDEAKGMVIRFQQADRVKEFHFPMLWDAGIYRPGTLYPKGAGVTAQGSFWIAQSDTSERPGDGSTSWRLAVKRGRDGKDGKDGKNGDES